LLLFLLPFFLLPHARRPTVDVTVSAAVVVAGEVAAREGSELLAWFGLRFDDDDDDDDDDGNDDGNDDVPPLRPPPLPSLVVVLWDVLWL
jgi:hypothetical protein